MRREFYECTDGAWTLVWPLPTAEGATPSADEGLERLIAGQCSPRFAASSSRQFAGTRSAGPGTDWVAGWLSGGAR